MKDLVYYKKQRSKKLLNQVYDYILGTNTVEDLTQKTESEEMGARW